MAILPDQTLAHKLISKGTITYIATFLIAPVGYFLRILASNSMDVSAIGFFYSIMGFIGLLAAYNDLGLTEALQYFLPKYWIEKKYNHYKTIRILTFVAQLLSGALIGCILWFGSDRLGLYYFGSTDVSTLLKIFAFYFLAINILQALSSVYTAFQDVLADKIVEVVRLYSILGATLFFTALGSLNLDTFSYAWLGGLGIGLLVSLFICGIKYGHTLRLGTFVWDKKLVKTQLLYAFWVFLGLNAGTVLGQVDQQIVIVFLGAEYAGYFSNYLSLFGIYGILLLPITSLIFPITTELIAKKQREKLTLLINILYKYFSVFAISILCFFIALGPLIAQILYGAQFSYSGTLLQYGSVFIICNILLVINFGLLAGMGKVRERVMILVISLVINLLCNALSLWVLHRGLYGIILATGLGQLAMFVLSWRILYQQYTITYDWGFVLRNLLLSVVLSLGLWYGVKILYIEQTTRLLQFVYLIGLGIGYYCIIAGFNYKSVIGLRQQTKDIWMRREGV